MSTVAPTTSAPLVPVILPEAERELLEKALRGASGLSAAEAETATTRPPITTSPVATASVATLKVAEASGENAVASATLSERTAADIEARALPMKPRAAAENESPAKKEDLASAGKAKLTPLPPLEREEPSTPAPTVNLPQPPIPLEYPRTGR